MNQAMSEDNRRMKEQEVISDASNRTCPLQKIVASGIMLGDLRTPGSEDPCAE
jgi:hypothetical protein